MMTSLRAQILLALGLLCICPSAHAAEPSALYIFKSAKERAVAGLARQRARKGLADKDYQRGVYLTARGAISAEEFDILSTAATVAKYDLEIAEAGATRAAITLDLATALARNGQRIPLCKRKTQSDENTVSDLLKLLKKKSQPPLPNPIDETRNTGTSIRIPDPEPPPPPENPPVEPPPPPVNPGNPPGTGGGGGPDPGPDGDPPPAAGGGSSPGGGTGSGGGSPGGSPGGNGSTGGGG